jgi:hypothetical protein
VPASVPGQHLGGGLLPGAAQVVVQAGELDRALDLAVHHLGADAALAYEQALVDEVLDGLADRRPRQAELVGQQDLVVQPGAGHQVSAPDRLGDLLGHLEVERHGAGAIQVDPQVRGHADQINRGQNVLTNISC